MGCFCLKTTSFSVERRQKAAGTALDRTVAHIIDHNSGLERAKRKVERSGPAPIVVELEQTINTVA